MMETCDIEHGSTDTPELPLNEVIERAGLGLFQWRLLFLCGTAFVADAMEIVMMAFIIRILVKEFSCSHFTVSIVAAAAFVGMFFGSTVLGSVSDVVGRRKSLAICMAFTGVAGVLSAVSPNVWVFLLFRVLVGVGVGGLHISITLFTEFLPRKHRALMLTLIQTFWAIGTIMQCGIAWAMQDVSWRWYVAVSALPSFFSGLTYFAVPESPIFLHVNGFHREALALLCRVAAVNKSRSNLPECFTLTKQTQHSTVGFRERISLLSKEGTRRLVGCLSFIWFSGSFVYYGSVFLTALLSYGHYNPYVAMMIITISEFPGKIGTYLCAEYMGRRSALIASSCVTALSLCLLGAQVHLPLWLVVTSMAIYRLAISIFITVTCIYCPEAFPADIRSTGFGFSIAFGRVAGMLTPFVAILVTNINVSLSASLYAVVMCIGLGFAIALPFDTTEMSLTRVS